MKKGKVITFIGIIIMILVAASYILFEAFVQDTSNVTAQNIIVAKEDIADGTVVHNLDEAKAFFEVKRINSENVVDGAIIIDSADLGDQGLMSKIQDTLDIKTVSEDDLKQLIGYKLTRTYTANEQILAEYLSTDVVEFSPEERLFAVETSYVNSVAAEIKEGDYVDLWLVSTKNNETISKKLIGPLKIYKLKTSDNVTIPPESNSVPSIVLFKLDEDTIEYISTMKNEGTVFFVKYGVAPTQEDVDAALEKAQEQTPETEVETPIKEVETTDKVKESQIIDSSELEEETPSESVVEEVEE